MKTILVFLLIFSVIVVIHEFGHFYFAKKAGIKVREFAIGMGPKLFSHQGADGTTYTLRILPMGGYVRLAGLNEEDDIEPGMEIGLTLNQSDEVQQINVSDALSQDELPVRVNQVDLINDMTIEALPSGGAEYITYPVNRQATIIEADQTNVEVAPYESRYEAASPWSKFKTNIAGPINNFILSIIVFTIIGFLLPGIPMNSPEPIIGTVTEGSAAEEAGLEANDVITAVNQEPVTDWNQMVSYIQPNPGEQVQVTYERDGHEYTTELTIDQTVDSETGEEYGIIGVIKGDRYDTRFISRLTYGVTATFNVIMRVLAALKEMFVSGFSIDNFGGPVAMAQMTSQVVEFGFIPVLNFMAWLSANLGIINLLPIPALDGGKIVLNIIEGVRGKPVSQSTEGIITLIGVGLLFILMILVTWNDIQRAFF
ncbi:RIP metalloprotease RseP [Aerococcaceae bacterium DSM 111020]|nr:RIP metalloprotease RseP [Aerococcaceae bacterium DSM 111020]